MHHSTLTVSQNVLKNIYVRASVQCPLPTCIHDLRLLCHWSIVASIISWPKSNQVCIKHFHGSSTSWFIPYTHYCTTPKIS